MTVAVCLKWIVPLEGDDRFGVISPADQAALELALRLADLHGDEVLAATVGPVGAESALRLALACGAHRGVRVDGEDQLDSAQVAESLGAVVGGSTWVCCGDYSLDRGTGSVPAFLADELACAQALGLIEVTLESGRVHGLRRLDGGRRERIVAEAPCVLSLEGATLTLRRASLSATLAAERAEIEQRRRPHRAGPMLATRPFRPRARVVDAPAGTAALERLQSVLAAGGPHVSHHDPIVLDPAQAARAILNALTDWGYME
jgi:electron transfer flavoprotein beta subunit